MRPILFICVLLIFSCKPDKAQAPVIEIKEVDLVGEWNIYHATRNGKETKSLENGNFVFQSDNTLKSNLLNTENSYTFTIIEDDIVIDESETLKKLKIKSFQKDSIILSSKMKVFDLEFFLVRK